MASDNRDREINDILRIICSNNLSGNVNVAPASSGQKQLNLLLLGKTGHGKSATGNSTLGRREFISSSSVSSVTSEVQSRKGVCNKYVINVIDTPGLADTQFETRRVEEIELVIANMKKVTQMSPGGIHAFLFVVTFGNRFTEEDKNSLHTLKQIFGPRFLEMNGIIIFTHGDLFEQSMEEDDMPDKSFDEWCKEQKGALGQLIAECDHRCVLFNNRQCDEKARQKQMQQLTDLVEVFKGPYTVDDFTLYQNLRNKLIVELKLPKLKASFQLEVDNLNSQIHGRFQTADTNYADFVQMLDNLTNRINTEERGTGLLGDMKAQVSTARWKINSHISTQQERRRQEQKSSCSIL